MLGQNFKNEPIYKHEYLDARQVEKIKPLMESAFRNQLNGYTGSRKGIKDNLVKFSAEQYANRARVAGNSGESPLFEDAKIFGHIGQLKNLFESVSQPGNIVGLGNVSNPDSSHQHTGGIWNSAYKAGSGDIPSYVFGLQAHLAYHCIGFDLIPTISVDTPKVTLQYVDTVYGGGTFDDVDNLPSYLEISNNVLTAAWAKEAKLKRATTELIFATDADGKAVKARFMVRSTVKAALTIEILAVGSVTAGVFTANKDASVAEIINEINAATAPVVIVDTVETPLVVGDTKIDYASAIRTNIAEATSNDNTRFGMQRAQHRKGPKHKLNVIAMDKQVEVKGIEIEADTDNIQIKDMAAMGVNVIARLYNGVQNALVQTIDEAILDHLYKLGVQNAVNTVRSQGNSYSLYIAAPSKTEISFNDIDVEFLDMLGKDVKADMGTIKNSIVSSSYENQMTHADRLYARILLIAEFMAQQNRSGAPDFIVLPGTLASCLKKNATFTVCPTANTLSSNPELHYTGTVFNTINVYKNPKIDFSDPRVLMGRRGDDTDPGAKFIAYDLAASRQTLAEQTMAEKIRVWSRFTIEDIGFYPELNYFTFVAINEYNWA